MRPNLISPAFPVLLLLLAIPPILADEVSNPAVVTPTPVPAAWPAAQETGPFTGMAHVRPGLGLVLQPGSSLWVHGATDQRFFKLWAGSLLGTVVLKSPLGKDGAGSLLDQVKREGVLTLELAVPIVGLKASDSEIERGSDYALAGPYPTLHGKENPNVEFRLTEVAFGKEVRPGVHSIEAKGELTIAGVAQDIRLPAEAAFTGNQVRVTGQYKVRLSVFKIKVLQDVWGSMGPNPTVDVTYDVTFAPPPFP